MIKKRLKNGSPDYNPQIHFAIHNFTAAILTDLLKGRVTR
jgi:hypothetical protein